MKIFTIILGVLMAICGISCMCTPVMTFLEAGYFLVILLLVYGIAALDQNICSMNPWRIVRYLFSGSSKPPAEPVVKPSSCCYVF